MFDDFDKERIRQAGLLRKGLEEEGEEQVRLMVASGAYSNNPEQRRIVMHWLRQKDEARSQADGRRRLREGLRDWGAFIAAIIAAAASAIALFR